MIRTVFTRVIPAILAIALAVVGWRTLTSSDPIVLTATFDDVVDLVQQASVQAGDVQIGTVADIELTSDHRARVTMHVQRGTGLPAQVTAVLRQTSILGERFVELRPVEGVTGTLASGTIRKTSSTADLEDLVGNGADLLAYVAADRLSQMVRTGAAAFGGQGLQIAAVLQDLESFVADYDQGKDTVLRLLDNADAMLAGLAPDAEVHAGVLDDLDRATKALGEEDDRLFDALGKLNRLSDVGAQILQDHRGELDRLFPRLRRVVAQLTRVDGALQNFLTWFPRHNLHVANGVLDEMSQVWNDFTVCGYDDEPDNPANSCTPSNPGRSNSPPPGYAPDDCDYEHQGCPYPSGVEPNQQPVREGSPSGTSSGGSSGDGGSDGGGGG